MVGWSGRAIWPCSRPPAAAAAGGGTVVTYVGVPGAISFGMTQSPTGCNPNTPVGDTPGPQPVLAGVLPSPFVVNSAGQPTSNSQLIAVRADEHDAPDHRLHLEPEGGVVRRRADHGRRLQVRVGGATGRPVVSSPDVASIAGYRDIGSVTGSNGGHTVTVKFKTPFADWQMLFANLVPAHVMEKVGWNPSCSTVDPAIDLSGGPFKIGRVSRPRSRSCRTRNGGDSRQLAVDHGPRRVLDGAARPVDGFGLRPGGAPTTVTPAFLTQMTGLPGAQSEVDTSATLLQLDMASSLDSQLSPDLRVAIGLLINRQDLVNQQASWAVPGMQVADSHVYRAGPSELQARAPSPPTTTIPAPSSSTSTTAIGAGGSVNFPVTPVPDQAAALIQASGLVRTPGNPYYHSAFGAPFSLHMVVDESDPWAAAAAPVIQAELLAAGLDTTLYPVASAGRRADPGRGVRRPGGACR